MREPDWVPISVVVTIHDRQISRHGGAPGLRDRAHLESGCTRPLNAHAYGDPDVFEIAAAHAFGIAKAHAFVDGNRRTAYVTAVTFLGAKGFGFRPDPDEGVKVMEDLASDALSEAAFADWLRAGAVAIQGNDGPA